MGLYSSTFAAYAVATFLGGSGIFLLLLYDGAFVKAECTDSCLLLNYVIVLVSSVVFSFVPWSIWRHLQPIDKKPKYAGPVAALVGLALSDLYLIFVSAVGRSEPVNDQLFFLVCAAVIGAIIGPTYSWLESYFRRPMKMWRLQ